MVIMRTVGEILRQKRQEKQLDLVAVAQITRIKLPYLEAIEAGDWAKLPPIPFTKGLIRNYAQCLGLNPSEILAVFRRQYDEQKEITPTKSPFIMQSFIRFTPNTLLRVALVVIVSIFLLYFLREYRILTGPPTLLLDNPKENVIVTDANVPISGKTSSEAVVTVNGQTIAINDDGTFQTSLEMLQTGQVNVTATSKSGKATTIERTVVIQ